MSDYEPSEHSQRMSEVMREKHATDSVYHKRVCDNLASCTARRSKKSKYEHKLQEKEDEVTYTERMALKDQVLADSAAKGRILRTITALEKHKLPYLVQDSYDILVWLHKQTYVRTTEIKLNSLRKNAKRRAEYFLKHHCLPDGELFDKEE